MINKYFSLMLWPLGSCLLESLPRRKPTYLAVIGLAVLDWSCRWALFIGVGSFLIWPWYMPFCKDGSAHSCSVTYCRNISGIAISGRFLYFTHFPSLLSQPRCSRIHLWRNDHAIHPHPSVNKLPVPRPISSSPCSLHSCHSPTLTLNQIHSWIVLFFTDFASTDLHHT